jgi:hypothetical protein
LERRSGRRHSYALQIPRLSHENAWEAAAARVDPDVAAVDPVQFPQNWTNARRRTCASGSLALVPVHAPMRSTRSACFARVERPPDSQTAHCTKKLPSSHIRPRSWRRYRVGSMSAFVRSRDERKRVEMRFAHLKSHHDFERMRLRGGFPVRETSFISPSSSRISRRLRFESSHRDRNGLSIRCVGVRSGVHLKADERYWHRSRPHRATRPSNRSRFRQHRSKSELERTRTSRPLHQGYQH